MDYEKEYKEALERARQYHKVDKDNTLKLYAKGTMEYLFPVLKEESDDEKIRKALIRFHKSTIDIDGIKGEEIIAWLEKQGESKFEHGDDNATKVFKNEDGTKKEPKFKVDDWIVDNFGSIWKIEGILLNQFYLLEGVDGISQVRPTIERVDKTYHLWTIKDAKDGDVLVGNERSTILMFRGIGNTEWNDVIDYHCYYDCYWGRFIVQKDLGYWGNTENNQLMPATKEQSDLLFQKMKEAGYEWDAEKKELKKILVIDEGKSEMDYCFTKMMNGEKVSPTWGEEDEEMFDAIIADIQFTQKAHNHEVNQVVYEREIDWFKTLKERMKGE